MPSALILKGGPDQSRSRGRAVECMNRLRPLEHWGRGFESHSRYGCLCLRLFCVYVVLYVGSGLATG
jgi:hypothetical protein